MAETARGPAERRRSGRPAERSLRRGDGWRQGDGAAAADDALTSVPDAPCATLGNGDCGGAAVSDGSGATDVAEVRHAALLVNPRISQFAGDHRRLQLLWEMQAGHGNAHDARVVSRLRAEAPPVEAGRQPGHRPATDAASVDRGSAASLARRAANDTTGSRTERAAEPGQERGTLFRLQCTTGDAAV